MVYSVDNEQKPRQLVLEALQYVDKGDALDLGCGWGRDALFLASKGFRVDAVDSDPNQLQILEQKAPEFGIEVHAEERDVRDFEVNGKQYDLILSAMVLHFLSKHAEMISVVKKMQERTKDQGVHAICAYSDKSQEGARPYLLNAEELLKLYDGWEILRFEELPGTDEVIDGPHNGKIYWRVELIARRKV